MKRWGTFVLLASIGLAAVYFGWRWKQDEPRRHCFEALRNLDTALHAASGSRLQDYIVIPTAVQNRTLAEQNDFLAKALRDEVSAEGLAVLKREGTFGPLTNIFPAEAEAWAKQAGVRAQDCVAFKLERNGLRAEVVLVLNPDRGTRSSQLAQTYRVVRLNNVKQLASLSATNPSR